MNKAALSRSLGLSRSVVSRALSAGSATSWALGQRIAAQLDAGEVDAWLWRLRGGEGSPPSLAQLGGLLRALPSEEAARLIPRLRDLLRGVEKVADPERPLFKRLDEAPGQTATLSLDEALLAEGAISDGVDAILRHLLCQYSDSAIEHLARALSRLLVHPGREDWAMREILSACRWAQRESSGVFRERDYGRALRLAIFLIRTLPAVAAPPALGAPGADTSVLGGARPSGPSLELLRVLRAVDEDGALAEIYAFYLDCSPSLDRDLSPLEEALLRWRDAGYPNG